MSNKCGSLRVSVSSDARKLARLRDARSGAVGAPGGGGEGGNEEGRVENLHGQECW